jgi:hypothetical protein
LPGATFALAPSCRLVASRYPILRIWKVNQIGHTGDPRVALDEGPDRLLVRREPQGVTIERIAAGEYALLAAFTAGLSLAKGIEAAQGADASFDLGTVLRARIADGAIAGIRTE